MSEESDIQKEMKRLKFNVASWLKFMEQSGSKDLASIEAYEEYRCNLQGIHDKVQLLIDEICQISSVEERLYFYKLVRDIFLKSPSLTVHKLSLI